MKNYKVLSIVFLFLITLVLAFNAIAQEEAAPKNEKRVKVTQQKITTPPLQLTEEEEKRAPIKIDVQKPEEKKKPGPATAEVRTPPEELEFTPKPLKSKTKIELILDASGSMKGLMGSSTKMEILKSVVNDIISLPPPEGAERDIGLRVYGNQKASEESDCKDTQLLAPISPLDVKTFKDEVDSITALGVTPIGFTLEEASKDFTVSEDYDNVIILVADGADSCDANVCQITSKLNDSPKKILIHVIGFDLDQKATKSLSCIAKNGDGQFIIARSENELASSLEQVLMANIPYNLRIKVVSGASSLPSKLTVYKSRTKNIVREDETSGMKFYQLPPGTYDIEVVYSESKESPQPSKLIKNVEVQATSKAEQVVQFDLGLLTLEAFDQNGKATAAEYLLTKKEDPSVKVTVKSETGPFSTWLTRGSYNVTVNAVNEEGLELTTSVDGLEIKGGQALKHDFRFQVGKLRLVGKDSKGKEVALTYRVAPAGDEEKTILEGSTPKGGGIVDIPPGKYDIYAAISINKLKDLPGIKIEGIEIVGDQATEKIVEIPSATLKLVGKDSEGKEVETKFTIKPSGSEEEPAEYTFKKEPVTLTLPPTSYDISALLIETDTAPPPSLSWSNIALTKDQELTQEAVFKFGMLKLYGRDIKGTPLQTTFYIYKPEKKEAVASYISTETPVEMKLIQGYYDIKAENASSRNDPKPSTWFHNVHVTAEAQTYREAIFTNGLLKMACRGPNDVQLECIYKLFAYGMDSPLFEGTTVDQWKEFDIPPGSYYIEAGYHDTVDEVLLKKWITIRIKPNEMLEQVIRF